MGEKFNPDNPTENIHNVLDYELEQLQLLLQNHIDLCQSALRNNDIPGFTNAIENSRALIDRQWCVINGVIEHPIFLEARMKRQADSYIESFRRALQQSLRSGLR